MKIIDAHMHILQFVRADGETAFDAIKEYQKMHNIAFVDNMACSNNADLWDGYEMDQTIIGAIAKLENPKVFTHGCLYIPKDEKERKNYDFCDQLDELMELGMDGVKICDFKPDAYKILDVERHLDEYDKFIGKCEKYAVHNCWHVADPRFFWNENEVPEDFKRRGWFYGDGTHASYENLINLAYDMINAHPNLHVLLAHAFFKSNEPNEVRKLLSTHPNVGIDLAPGAEMFDGFRKYYDEWYNIFRDFSDRFMFATDISTSSTLERVQTRPKNVLRFLQTDDEFDFNELYKAKGIKLEKEHLENILYKNHDREVGFTPRHVNKNALKKYILRYLPLMPDSNNKRMIEDYYKKNLL